MFRRTKKTVISFCHFLTTGYTLHVLLCLIGALSLVISLHSRSSSGPKFVSDAGEETRRSCKDCKTVLPQCSLTPVLKKRYKSLPGSSHILIAIALHNSESILRNMGAQLEEIVDFIGPEFVSLSVYEGGSRDSSAVLLHELAGRMEVKGVTTHVMTGGPKINWDHVHRIGALADIRNMVLKRLFEDVDRVHRTGSVPKYQTVIYLNDIVFCAADVLELLKEHVNQEAHLTCPMDFGAWNKYKRPYYDLWVGRTLAGDILYDAFSGYADGAEEDTKSGLTHLERQRLRDKGWSKSLDSEPFWQDEEGRSRARQGLPVQVYSCWNGGVIFNTRPVYENGLKFRRGYSPECSESECSHFSKDLWNLGYGRIQIVPSVGVAYSMEDYKQVRSVWESLSESNARVIPMYYLSSAKGAVQSDTDTDTDMQDRIQWVEDPPERVICFVLDRMGERGVDWTRYKWISPVEAPLPGTFPLPF